MDGASFRGNRVRWSHEGVQKHVAMHINNPQLNDLVIGIESCGLRIKNQRFARFDHLSSPCDNILARVGHIDRRMRREDSGGYGISYLVSLRERYAHIRCPLGEHGFDKRHPPTTLDLAAKIQEFFGVFWKPEEARTLQPEVDNPPDATLDTPTAYRETFRSKCMVLHTGFVGLKVLHRC